MVTKLIDIRDHLYDTLPTGHVEAWQLLEIIKKHLKELDDYIDLQNSVTKTETDTGHLVDMPDLPALVKKGIAQAMDGTTLWINTTTDERITVHIKDDKLRWRLYCKPVKVTFEIIDDTDL